MKVKLYIHKCVYTGNLSLNSTTSEYHGVMLREATVDLPDDIEPSDEKWEELVYLHNLSAAERVVEEKRAELTKAEHIVKNMMAIEHKV